MFRGFLKYANLQSWREQSWHEFLGTTFKSNGNYLMCTCGLDVLKSDLESVALSSREIPEEIAALDLSGLERVRHHIDFSAAGKPVCALIVDFIFDSSDKTYLWTAYCQVCLALIRQVENDVAVDFVNVHNKLHLA